MGSQASIEISWKSKHLALHVLYTAVPFLRMLLQQPYIARIEDTLAGRQEEQNFWQNYDQQGK